jgi:hypothetical protein
MLLHADLARPNHIQYENGEDDNAYSAHDGGSGAWVSVSSPISDSPISRSPPSLSPLSLSPHQTAFSFTHTISHNAVFTAQNKHGHSTPGSSSSSTSSRKRCKGPSFLYGLDLTNVFSAFDPVDNHTVRSPVRWKDHQGNGRDFFQQYPQCSPGNLNCDERVVPPMKSPFVDNNDKYQKPRPKKFLHNGVINGYVKMTLNKNRPAAHQIKRPRNSPASRTRIERPTQHESLINDGFTIMPANTGFVSRLSKVDKVLWDFCKSCMDTRGA